MKFNPRRHHSPSYYKTVLEIVMLGIASGWSMAAIRARLEASGSASPTNGQWTEPSLNGVLARVRQRRGPFYTRLLELHLEGEATAHQVSQVLRSH